jgi:hypothetical protein
MYVNILTYLLHLRVFLSFLRTVRGNIFPGNSDNRQSTVHYSKRIDLLCLNLNDLSVNLLYNGTDQQFRTGIVCYAGENL